MIIGAHKIQPRTPTIATQLFSAFEDYFIRPVDRISFEMPFEINERNSECCDKYGDVADYGLKSRPERLRSFKDDCKMQQRLLSSSKSKTLA